MPKIAKKEFDKTPRRVRKGEIQRKSQDNQDPFDYCICSWKEWMYGDADRDLGLKAMGGLISNADGYGTDPAEQDQARDTRIAIATDAMIDSLKLIHRWAIYESTGVATAWKFPNANLITTYEAARQELEGLLRKNVCTGVLF